MFPVTPTRFLPASKLYFNVRRKSTHSFPSVYLLQMAQLVAASFLLQLAVPEAAVDPVVGTPSP